MTDWLRFAAIQALCAVTDAIGLVLLAPFCLAQSWRPALSTQWAPDAAVKAHTIDVWAFAPLNAVWGNPEDGVLGPVSFLTGWPPCLRAYAWSALRNRSDNLKYIFARPGGPFIYAPFTVFGKAFVLMAGFRNAAGLVTLSIGTA